MFSQESQGVVVVFVILIALMMLQGKLKYRTLFYFIFLSKFCFFFYKIEKNFSIIAYNLKKSDKSDIKMIKILKSMTFFMAFSVACLASAQDFYKWVDAQGTTHYTQTPPPKAVTKPKKVQTYGWKNSQPTVPVAVEAPTKKMERPTAPSAASEPTALPHDLPDSIKEELR